MYSYVPPVHPPVRGGANGRDERQALRLGQRNLSRSGRPAACSGAGRPLCPKKQGRPFTFRNALRTSLHARETRSTGHAGRVAGSGCAFGLTSFDLTGFPAPDGLGAGASPPISSPAALELPDTRRRSSTCRRLPWAPPTPSSLARLGSGRTQRHRTACPCPTPRLNGRGRGTLYAAQLRSAAARLMACLLPRHRLAHQTVHGAAAFRRD